MADFREAPCIFYNAHGDCEKEVKNADYNRKCQRCKKYMPRKGYKAIGNNVRKRELEKWIE